MRLSQFWELMNDEFGSANAQVIASSLVLPEFHTTAEAALAAGHEPKHVWIAVCDLHDVPESARLGKIKPKKDDTPF